MRTLPKSLFLPLLLPPVLMAADAPRPCSVRKLEDIRLSAICVPGSLLATGTVQSVANHAFIMSDDSGYTRISSHGCTLPKTGTVIETICTKVHPLDRNKELACLKWNSLGVAPVASPLKLRLDDLDEHRHNLHSVTVEGTVVDLIADEIDSRYCILLLKDGGTTIPCFAEQSHLHQELQDARVQLTGTYYHLATGFRRFSGPFLNVTSKIAVIAPAPNNLLNAPNIDPGDYITPKDIAQMDRRSLVGTVLATWGGNQAMLRSENVVVNIVFGHSISLPPCGQTIKVAGYPGTDLYHLVLSKCVWAPADASRKNQGDDMAMDVSPRLILNNAAHATEFKYEYYGRLIRLRGVVRALPGEGNADRRLLVEADGFRIPVDFSSSPSATDDIALGCEIEVTGRCLMESENWKPYEVLPQITGLAVVLRQPNDIRVLSRPPWWTPARLLTAIGVILAGLLGAFVWVFALHRLAERRGRELFEERRAREEERRTREVAELRMQDRTRLAVELHDTISQNLTGATMQMGTAAQLLETDAREAAHHIDIATRTLDSCRQELRNCIWDLRNNTLDVPDLNEAIRLTIQRLVGEIELQIRFNIRREALSDNTVHALMRIVRELATNAVRHGAAKTVRVAGALEDGILRFSVTDDGRGFDPERRPGLNEGHFGLQGVEERVSELGGEMKITSSPGKGTRVAIWIRSEC